MEFLLSRSLSGRTVLLVEDEFLILLDLQMVLEEQGAEVVTAGSVAEGIRATDTKEDLDAAVLDVRLPDGEVFPVAEKLTERDVPIVFHSGHARIEDLTERFPKAKALSKPAPERVLVDVLMQQFGRETMER